MLALTGDVSVPEQVAEAVDRTVRAYGRIDALVNNAGIAIFKPVLETSYEGLAARAGDQPRRPLPLHAGLRAGDDPWRRGQRRQHRVDLGLRASTLRLAYGTSKAAVMQLTRQQTAELGHVGIRVNAVAPGPVDTAMALQVHSPAIRADYHAAIPLDRYGTPEEIAAVVVFLCSAGRAYVTGRVISVDGGFESTGIGLTDAAQAQFPSLTEASPARDVPSEHGRQRDTHADVVQRSQGKRRLVGRVSRRPARSATAHHQRCDQPNGRADARRHASPRADARGRPAKTTSASCAAMPWTASAVAASGVRCRRFSPGGAGQVTSASQARPDTSRTAVRAWMLRRCQRGRRLCGR